jgi:hypothetical protein
MAATAEKKRRAPARGASRRKKKKHALLIWWPLLVGIIVTPFATHAADILALKGPSALRMLYPYVLLVKEPLFHLAADMANTLSQGMMYAQFPLYGLLMSLLLRSKSVGFALAAVAIVHIAGILALLSLAQFFPG